MIQRERTLGTIALHRGRHRCEDSSPKAIDLAVIRVTAAVKTHAKTLNATAKSRYQNVRSIEIDAGVVLTNVGETLMTQMSLQTCRTSKSQAQGNNASLQSQ